MELRDMECLIVLSEELHFGRAAARLNIAQPPLTKRLQKLEASLGLKLFERSSHGVALTDAGVEILGQARRVLAAADRTRHLARALRTGGHGVVRIAAVGSAFFEALPRVLQPVQQALPGIRLLVEELETTQLIEALRFGEAQLGFIRPPATHGLETQTVWVERFVAAVGADSDLASRAAVSVEELVDQNIVFFERQDGTGYWDRVAAMFHARGFDFQPGTTAPHVTSMVGLVALGVGVSIVPESARRLNPPGVVYKPLVDAATLPLSVAFQRGRLGHVTQRVLDALPLAPLIPLGDGPGDAPD